jgi:hypothetical protein
MGPLCGAMASGVIPPLREPIADPRSICPPVLPTRAISDVADMWNCSCRGGCTALTAAQCLYHATIDALDRGEAEAEGRTFVQPLAVVVSRQKTLIGQETCRRYAEAMAVGDHAAALAVCHALIATEQERVGP